MTLTVKQLEIVSILNSEIQKFYSLYVTEEEIRSYTLEIITKHFDLIEEVISSMESNEELW